MPHMVEQGWGRVINLSSWAWKSGGLTAGTAYSASKAAMVGLTFSLARQFAADGVTVNAHYHHRPSILTHHQLRRPPPIPPTAPGTLWILTSGGEFCEVIMQEGVSCVTDGHPMCGGGRFYCRLMK